MRKFELHDARPESRVDREVSYPILQLDNALHHSLSVLWRPVQVSSPAGPPPSTQICAQEGNKPQSGTLEWMSWVNLPDRKLPDTGATQQRWIEVKMQVRNVVVALTCFHI